MFPITFADDIFNHIDCNQLSKLPCPSSLLSKNILVMQGYWCGAIDRVSNQDPSSSKIGFCVLYQKGLENGIPLFSACTMSNKVRLLCSLSFLIFASSLSFCHGCPCLLNNFFRKRLKKPNLLFIARIVIAGIDRATLLSICPRNVFKNHPIAFFTVSLSPSLSYNDRRGRRYLVTVFILYQSGKADSFSIHACDCAWTKKLVMYSFLIHVNP